MLILQDQVIINNVPIKMGMSFESVCVALQKYVSRSEAPNENGTGYIVIEGEELYGLKGPCSLVFLRWKLDYVGVSLDWQMYKNENVSFKSLHVDEAVDFLLAKTEEQLRQDYAIIKSTRFGNKIFESGNIDVYLNISRDWDSYSLTVRDKRVRSKD